jgi:fatty-acyl-CoA synthase
MNAVPRDEEVFEHHNLFLSPMIARWRENPNALLGVFHDGENWHEVSNQQFMRRVSQFAALLSVAGVGAGNVVLMVLEHGADAHAAFLGAMFIGAVPALMPSPNAKQDARLYWKQHREVFSHIKPRAIIVTTSLCDAVSAAADGSAASIIPVFSVDSAAPTELDVVPNSSDIGLLQHSSGTTGLKKGVALSYEAITTQLSAYREALATAEVVEPRFASWLPLYHDMGLISSFLMPMWLGYPILSIDPFEWTKAPYLLFEAIQNYRGTHTWLPNFALLHHSRSARKNERWDLSSLRAVICCSEPNKTEAFDAFLERFSDWGISPSTLQTCYAMAETVFAVSQSRVGNTVRRLSIDRLALQADGLVKPPSKDADEAAQTTLLSNGRPISGCQVKILKDGKFVGEGAVGEICVVAPFLFSGYFNSPALTEQAFYGQWLRTGDLGFLEQGEIFIVGRLKDIIIVNGKNIVAHDVEAAVSRVPHVKPGRAVAFGQYVPANGSEQLVVIAERLEAGPADAVVAGLINRAVAEEIGVTCNDVRLVDIGWLIKTTSGKMSRSENKTKYIEIFL